MPVIQPSIQASGEYDPDLVVLIPDSKKIVTFAKGSAWTGTTPSTSMKRRAGNETYSTVDSATFEKESAVVVMGAGNAGYKSTGVSSSSSTTYYRSRYVGGFGTYFTETPAFTVTKASSTYVYIPAIACNSVTVNQPVGMGHSYLHINTVYQSCAKLWIRYTVADGTMIFVYGDVFPNDTGTVYSTEADLMLLAASGHDPTDMPWNIALDQRREICTTAEQCALEDAKI